MIAGTAEEWRIQLARPCTCGHRYGEHINGRGNCIHADECRVFQPVDMEPLATFRIDLPWTTPPLTANQRMHWAKKAAVVKEVRQTAFLLSQKAPHADKLVVTLHYRPRDIRRRDSVNLYPTLKACVDGLIDRKICPDDDTAHVSTPEPVIHAPDGTKAAMWLQLDYPDTGAAA